MSYRIGFLNPWKEAAENQAFHSLAVAARRLGHELIHAANSDELLAARPDFALAVDPGQPKTTAVPTFGGIHSPRPVLLEYQSYFDNLLSYDGYLTIADSLEHFLHAFCAAAGKPRTIGRFFHHTSQRQEIAADIAALVERGALHLCYFGRNWEPRARPLFRALAKRRYMRFYGPPKAWEYLGDAAYKGSMPFDGLAVHKTYASFGAGLDVLSRSHALDDVVSSRIFEIAAVGAAAICPAIPWIRKHFADTVFYYDPFDLASPIVAAIDRAMAEIARDPQAAGERAAAARAVFERDFAAETMLGHAVEQYEGWREGAGKPSDPAAEPAIDVVMPVGDRPLSQTWQAVRSIDAQSRGRFRVVFVRRGPVELAEILRAAWWRIADFEIVDVPGGGRAALLAAGLATVSGDYFAVLEDDAAWLPGHVAALLAPLAEAEPGAACAFAGIVAVDTARAATVGQELDPNKSASSSTERRHIRPAAPAGADLRQILTSLSVNGFLAPARLRGAAAPDLRSSDTAADAVLLARLVAGAEPVFSQRATAVVPAAGQATAEPEDAFEFLAAVHGFADDVERKLRPQPLWPALKAALQRLVETRSAALGGDASRLVLEGNTVVPSLYRRDDIERRPIALDPARLILEGASRLTESSGEPVLEILPPPRPWVWGARLLVDRAELFAGPQWAVAEFAPVAEPLVIGLVNRAGDGYLLSLSVPVSNLPVELWLEIADPEDLSLIAFGNWQTPLAAAAVLRKVWLVRERDASE